MPTVDINWLAVIVAAAINMIVGALWYSNRLVAREWMKLVGKKAEDMDKMRSQAGPGYAIAAVGALIQTWVLAHFVQYTGATTFWRGLVTGFWLWLAFVGVTLAVGLIFEGRSWHLWKINAGYFLVVLLINGGLLAAWR
jgi:hypothetical protein